jgi:hypothetical protein
MYSGYSPFRLGKEDRELHQPRSTHAFQVYCPKLKSIDSHLYIYGDTMWIGGRVVEKYKERLTKKKEILV